MSERQRGTILLYLLLVNISTVAVRITAFDRRR